MDSIRQVHEQSVALVNRTVNTTLTVRNWVIGGYIHHYELTGLDRAKYGESLIERLAERLMRAGLERMDARELRRYRLLYMTYPGIRESVSPKFTFALPLFPTIRETVSPKLEEALKLPSIFRSLTGKSNTIAEFPIMETVYPQLVNSLSFSHFAELIEIEDPLKRSFYEIECIRGNWSVRTLRRQIAKLYFERSGLSKDKKKLAAMVKKGVETTEPKLAIRDPYIFEFLGLRAKDAMAESDLEAALVQYAIASMDNRLFVSKYAMELPSREELEKFLHARHLEMLGNG